MKILRRIIGKCCHLFYTNVASFLPQRGKIYMLHWVGDEKQNEETEPFRLSVEQFRLFLKWIKKQNVIHLKNWERADNFIAITIDDVPENFYINAFPLLKKEGIPFTIFVNVSLLDKEGFITREQLIEMAHCELCTVGSHGMSHGEFTMLNRQQAMSDLEESQKELECMIGCKVELFAYPYGSYYACGYTHKHLAATIYKYAFGTVACPITKPSLLKNYFLPRINVDADYVKKSQYENSKCYNSIL